MLKVNTYSFCKLAQFIFLVLISFISPAQFDFSPNKLSTNPEMGLEFNKFNQDVIAKNKIQAIKINYSTKPDNQPIKDYGYFEQFEFNEFGVLIRSMVVEEKMKKQELGHKFPEYYNDSLISWYYYNASGKLTIKRTFFPASYISWYYEYNENGYISKATKVREQNEGTDMVNFIPAAQAIVSLETYTYEHLPDHQLKIKCFNDENRVYKEIIKYFSDDNTLTLLRETHDFVVGWIHIESIYNYNTNKQLIGKTFSSNAGGDMNENFVLEYDTNGLLTLFKKIKNNETVYEDNFMYNDTNNLIKSRLSRDNKNKKIDIYKISYY